MIYKVEKLETVIAPFVPGGIIKGIKRLFS